MKRCALVVVLVLAVASPSSAQTVADRVISAFEAGARLRMQEQWFQQMQADRAAAQEYYRQQLDAMKAQSQALLAQARELDQARQKQQAQQPSALFASAYAEAQTVLKEFSMRHPDWPQYEATMMRYAQQVQRTTPQLPMLKYVEVLYFLAKSDEQDQAVTTAARAKADEVITAFSKLHPDWRQYEQRMIALSEAHPPEKGITDLDYLNFLYLLARK
jgi:hypothetical protein